MKADTVVVGGGIAGAAAAYFLSAYQSVILLEREDFPGYHATGRTAAVFTENYNSDIVSGLVRASRHFFESPPLNFCEYPLLDGLGVLTWAGRDQREQFEDAWLVAQKRVPSVERRDSAFAIEKVPILRRDLVAECIWEPGARSIDVNGLLQGYLRGLAKNGGRVVAGADVMKIARATDWHISTSTQGEFRASVLVNAAGAWAQNVAAMAGAASVTIEPRQRTALLIDLPIGLSAIGWPMVSRIGGSLYFRPSAGQLLVSPADQTPVTAYDATPNELDVAIAVERFQEVTTLVVSRIRHSWAGLRSFAVDELPVVGWDSKVAGFYWLAGQGGAGVKLSPVLGKIAAASIAGAPMPSSFDREGVDLRMISPCRF
jgi:D-arginine dehydrogenase